MVAVDTAVAKSTNLVYLYLSDTANAMAMVWGLDWHSKRAIFDLEIFSFSFSRQNVFSAQLIPRNSPAFFCFGKVDL